MIGKPSNTEVVLDKDFLLKHIGGEVKYFAFAVAKFRDPQASEFQVPLHDSALTRARVLIDFFINSGDKKSAYVRSLYENPKRSHPAAPPTTREWFEFISGRQSHIGLNREDPFDQWPDREPGEDKGEDRLDRLSHLVLALVRSRIETVRDDCRPALQEIVDRAEEYLRAPTEERFHAMDPANISPPLSDELQ